MHKHASIIITLSSACLYVLGLTFYQSYLISISIEETRFPLTFDRVLFQGFVSSITMGFKALLWLYLTAVGVVFVAVISRVMMALLKEHWLLSRIKSLFRDDRNKEKDDKGSFLELAIKIFEYLASVFFIFLAVYLVILASANVGK